MKINRSKFDLLLAKKCYTIKQVASLAGTSATSIQHAFDVGVRPDIVGLIARALEVEVEEII